jgi:long-chain fatty acid transport protein
MSEGIRPGGWRETQTLPGVNGDGAITKQVTQFRRIKDMSNINRISALAIGIASVLAMGQAAASGFQLRESSVANTGRAGAGSAVFTGDPSVVSANPAAMSGFDSKAFRVDATMIDLSATFTGGGYAAYPLTANPAAAPALTLKGGNGGNPGNPTLVPNMSFVMPLSGSFENVSLGASVGAPFGLKTEYDNDWVGRYNALTSDVKVIDFTLAASVKVGDNFSFGGGVFFERAEATLSKAIDFGSALCLQVNPALCLNPASPLPHPQGADGGINIHGSDNGFGFIFGMQFKPTDKFSIGYAHRSQVGHELKGTVDFTVPANVAAIMGASAAAYNDGPGGAKLVLPSTDTVSLRYDLTDRFRLLGDYQRTGWSTLRQVDVRRSNGVSLGAEAFNWKDTNFYSLGGEFDVGSNITLRAGVAKDESPTHDETRTPRLPDNNRTNYAVGLTWRVSQAFRVDAAFERITIDSPKIVNQVSSSASILNGSFSGYANIFGVAAQYNF